METGQQDTTMIRQCPQCGREIAHAQAHGLCPACLLKRGLEPESAVARPARSHPNWVPPSVELIAESFPELEVLQLLGRGGMGAVYKARQKSLNRLVALKILPPEFSHDSTFARRFAVEAQALAQLNHPNIVAIHDFGQRRDLFFFVMEFVDGMTLRQLFTSGSVTAKEALAIVPQICDALQFAHDHGIVHRDIKPDNLMLNRDGQVKIADFGLARIVGQPDAPAGACADPAADDASQAHIVGTPAYMAPEQLDSPEAVDHRADIYALGVVLYQMLTGELPADEPEPPSTKVLVDVRLDEVVLRALAREPGRRYQHVSDVKTQVQTIAMSLGPEAEAPAPALSMDRAGQASVFFVESPDGERTLQINANLDICGRPVRVRHGISLLQVARWIARTAGSMLLLITLVLLFAAGSPLLSRSPAGIPWDLLGMLLLVIGLTLGWFVEGAAAVLLFLGVGAFLLDDHASWFRGALEAPTLVGILYVWCWWLARLTRSRRRWRTPDEPSATSPATVARLRQQAAWSLLAVVLGALVVRWFVVAPYYVQNPLTGQISRPVWAFILDRTYRPDDAVIFRHNGKYFEGNILSNDEETDTFTLSSASLGTVTIPRSAIRGRVLFIAHPDPTRR